MPTETKTTRSTLTIRLTANETVMLNHTCDYVSRQGRTVPGPSTISHADALRQLAALGYKTVERAIRREAREGEPVPHPTTDDTSQTTAAPPTGQPPLPHPTTDA